MRLRLDKLVLSAGLALAMVATTIPVGAASTASSAQTTTVWAKDGTIVSNDNEAFEAAIAALDKTTGSSSAADGLTTTVGPTSGGAISAVTTLTDSTTATYSDKLIAKITNDGYTKSEKELDLSSGKEISDLTQETTYAYSSTYTSLSSQTEESAAITAAKAAATAALEEAAGKVGSTKTETSYGTKTVEVEVAESGDVSATKVGEDAYNAGTTTYTITGTYKKTTTYAIDDVSYFGYTLSLLLTGGFDADATNREYIVYKVDADGNITTLTPTVADNGLVVETTDLNAKYYTAYKTVSKSDALIFDETDTEDVAIINQAAKPTDEGKTGIAECIESNSFTPVSYFTINLVSGKTYSDTPITFKIAVPVDVDSNVTYKVLRFHEGNVDILDTTVTDGYIYFTTDKFSDYALVTVAADTTTNDETEEASNPTDGTTVADATDATAAAATEAAQGTGTTSGTGVQAGDNSMMPLFMTTLLLALCAGSLAIYKEKKTN